MTVYVDEIRDYGRKEDAPPDRPFWYGKWSHLWSDTSDAELDAFARRIGLKRSWAQLSRGMSGRFYHYDVRPTKRGLALKRGAVFIPFNEWLKSRMPTP